MPQIRVVFWNIQTFGMQKAYRTNPQSQCNAIAQVVFNAQADVLCVQEVVQAAIDRQYLNQLQASLNALPAPYNNWYFDWIKGSAKSDGQVPWATAADLNWDIGHDEGYAIFWNQNIAKFTLTQAPPIQQQDDPAVANTQSQIVRMQGAIVGLAWPGMAVPNGGIKVPSGNTPYTLPAQTTVFGQQTFNNPTQVQAGYNLPAGSVIGPGGVTLNTQVANVAPVVIPGNFTLTDATALPASDTVVVPDHVVSLVLFGLVGGANTYIGDIAYGIKAFNPGGQNLWDWLYFTSGAGQSAQGTGCRRPAYVTLDVNRTAAAADRLVPLVVYHAASKAPASATDMQRTGYAQQMYQAYDWANKAWINCNNAVIAGDFNVVMGSYQYAYNALTKPFNNKGANCTMAVNNPAPPNETQADNPLNKSMVAYKSLTGTQYYYDTLAEYRALAIDNVFYRGCGNATAGVLYDLLVAVTGGSGTDPAIPVAAIQGFINEPEMQQVLKAEREWTTPPDVPSLYAPSWTLYEIQQGQFGVSMSLGNNTQARRAAEFVNLFISDHLPVKFTMTM